jgi:hypothetical protein
MEKVFTIIVILLALFILVIYILNEREECKEICINSHIYFSCYGGLAQKTNDNGTPFQCVDELNYWKEK